jgi:outer membrane protein assembly complex protein YaeT
VIAALLLAAAPELASVRLEVPDADRERLSRYVAMAPGEPLQPLALRAAVQRLYATGEFQDVIAESHTDASGLHLVLRPVPAPRLARVRIEGDRVLDAGAARRAAGLEAGEALWPARLEAAASQVALHLARRGYLEARVEVRVERGGAAVFRVSSGPRVRVSRVAVADAPPGLARILEGLARPRAGEVFERARASRAAERMRQALVAHGRWRARAELEEAYDPDAARVALRFVISAGARQRVEFIGHAPSAGLRREVERLLREGGVSLDALETGADRIEAALRARGHREASVSYELRDAPGGEVVSYAIEAGPAWTAGAVRVRGADAALAQRLRTREGAPVQDADIDHDVRTLTAALEQAGHHEARVEAPLADAGGVTPVSFRVDAGPRADVEAFQVVVEGGLVLPRAASPRELRTRPGQPYRLRDLASDRRTLLLAWRNAGYLEADVNPEVAFDEERTRATLTLHVDPGIRTEVDHIIVRGLQDTREVVVRRELLPKPGSPLGLADLLESQRRLGTLSILERASITELDTEQPGRKSLLVDVREAPFTSFAYGLGYGDRDKLRGSLELTRRNLFGMDRSLTAFARGSFVSSRLLLTYREPYLLGRKLELFVTGFREEEDREGFDYVRGGGLVQTLFTLKPGRTLIARASHQRTDTFNVSVPEDDVDRQFRDATISGPSFTLIEDSRDDALDPRRGAFIALDVQLSLRALGGDSFLKSYLQASSYRRVLPRTLLAATARLGLARSFGFEEKTRLPLPERFFAGGDFSFRGFATDGVLREGGNSLLLGSLELRFDASRRFSLALFTDLGNVYPFVSDIDIGETRESAGVGLRYKSAFGPLRLDWAYKLDRRAGESASRLHLTVGHAF